MDVARSDRQTETTVYIGGILEKVTRSGVTEYRHRIEGGNGTAAIYVRRSSGSPATETYFVHRDQLGSPELVTNGAAAVVVRLSFGAYGERRDSDWDGAVSSADMTAIGNTTRRGFTGHEHLDAVGLVHMNGRVYEPVIGRMISPDAVVQIGAAQSVNCYAYVWNNPLTRTDPSGWVALEPDESWQHFIEWIAQLQRDHAEWEAAVERSYRREQARLRRPGPPERRQRPGGADGQGQPQGNPCGSTWRMAAAATMIEMLSGGYFNTDFERGLVINFLSHGPDVQLSADYMLAVRMAVSVDFARTASSRNRIGLVGFPAVAAAHGVETRPIYLGLDYPRSSACEPGVVADWHRLISQGDKRCLGTKFSFRRA